MGVQVKEELSDSKARHSEDDDEASSENEDDEQPDDVTTSCDDVTVSHDVATLRDDVTASQQNMAQAQEVNVERRCSEHDHIETNSAELAPLNPNPNPINCVTETATPPHVHAVTMSTVELTPMQAPVTVTCSEPSAAAAANHVASTDLSTLTRKHADEVTDLSEILKKINAKREAERAAALAAGEEQVSDDDTDESSAAKRGRRRGLMGKRRGMGGTESEKRRSELDGCLLYHFAVKTY